MIAKLKKLLDKLGGLALPMKLVLGSVLGIIIGPGALGFLSELATYSFAVNHGVRLPLEGIPYLRAAVTFGGVIISLTAAVVFFFALRIAAGLAAQIVRYIDSVQKIEDVVFPKDVRIFRSSEALRLIRELSFRWVTIVAVVGVFCVRQ